MTWIAIIGLVGWVIAGFAVGMWRGERRARIFIENFRAYGQSSPQRATAWTDEDAEDRVEETIDNLESIMGARVTRSGPEGNSKIEHDPETIENGIEYLLSMAKEEGAKLSRKDAKDEVERMLAAEGPEMI